jgi:hypothetical protein
MTIKAMQAKLPEPLQETEPGRQGSFDLGATNDTGASLAASMRAFVPNTQTEDEQASLAGAIEAL